MSLEARLQAASSDYQKLQADLSSAVEARQRLDAQLSENELVKKEFSTLTPNNVVFKLVGPVLVKQDQAEAKGNVDKRLEFIGGEIKRIEVQLQEIEQKSEKKKLELVELQTELQQRQKQDGSGGSAAST
ncbi:prefoldin subunit 6 [Lactarius psammicola]|nr:prefoldin subunit 6 [Lactarius psammicola]